MFLALAILLTGNTILWKVVSHLVSAPDLSQGFLILSLIAMVFFHSKWHTDDEKAPSAVKNVTENFSSFLGSLL